MLKCICSIFCLCFLLIAGSIAMVMSTRIKLERDDFPITAEALRIAGTVFLVIGTLGLPCKCVYHWLYGCDTLLRP
jgi:hypothetical protein